MAFIYSGEYSHPVPAPRRATLRRLNAHRRIVLARVDGFLHHMIEALAASKIQRIQRELALRGVRYDRSPPHATEPSE